MKIEDNGTISGASTFNAQKLHEVRIDTYTNKHNQIGYTG